MNDTFEVRDFRDKHFFIVDDVYLNGYAKMLGTNASMVYFTLCRHASKKQVAYPSQQFIANKLGISRVTVARKIKLLKEYNIIHTNKIRTKGGRYLNTVYTLLDKKVWKKLS